QALVLQALQGGLVEVGARQERLERRADGAAALGQRLLLLFGQVGHRGISGGITGIRRRGGRGRGGRRIRVGSGLRLGRGGRRRGGRSRGRRRLAGGTTQGRSDDQARVLGRRAAGADARQQLGRVGASVLVRLIVAVVVGGDRIGEARGHGLLAGVVVVLAVLQEGEDLVA